MNRMITVIVNPAGEIKIDAVGFKGADCEKATAYLEQALGTVNRKVKKPEYYVNAKTGNTQRIGQ